MSTTYYGTVPEDIVLEDAYLRDSSGELVRGANGKPTPIVYPHSEFLAEWVWGNPCWHQDAAWMDALDALRAKLHKKSAGTPWELGTDEREKILHALKNTHRTAAGELGPGYPNWLRPQITPFIRCYVSASTQAPKAAE